MSGAERIIVGPGDDAGIYMLDAERFIVETVDVITPVVNDPFTFGAIAAANSLSDIYAMGGRPLTALAIIGFPSCEEIAIVKEIMSGALDMLEKSSTSLMGGHSFKDAELKFGLAVTGIIDKDRILRAQGSRAGDIIVLTKPIGTGVLATALKGGKIKDADMKPAVNRMISLNDRASGAALKAGATSATDVTGFGLLGHAYNMVKNTPLDFELRYRDVPVFEGVRDLIAMGMVPEGGYNNLRFVGQKTEHEGVPEEEMLLLADPQTSGGLLITLPEGAMAPFKESMLDFSVIGRVVQGSGKIRLV